MDKFTLTEIKKALYKQKPKAVIINVSKEGITYFAELKGIQENKKTIIPFLVPFNDIGDAIFTTEMESQLLIRYIYFK